MNIGEIAEMFIRAAEVERSTREHVGPSSKTGFWPQYVHTFADKAGWRKEIGDKLEKGADPLSEERKAFWERLGMMATADEIRELDGLYDLLMMVDADGERRALLAWARSKVGGKAFRRWCFQVEGIHPETGRRRKDRALARIAAHLERSGAQNGEDDRSPLLHSGTEIDHLPDTVEEDVGGRIGLNSWMADNAQPGAEGQADFSWAQKRWQRRKRREERKRREREAVSPDRRPNQQETVMFHVGQKVACVSDFGDIACKPWAVDLGIEFPVKDEVYTVRRVVQRPCGDGDTAYGILLEEVLNLPNRMDRLGEGGVIEAGGPRDCGVDEVAFDVRDFRPLITVGQFVAAVGLEDA